MIKVFYDGNCGLCRKEINHYKKIAPDHRFEWVDVMQPEGEQQLETYQLSLAEALMHLHAADEQSQLHKGVDAFIVIWSNIPSWRFLTKIVKIPGVYHVAGVAYQWFAKWRFKRLAHCQQSLSD